MSLRPTAQRTPAILRRAHILQLVRAGVTHPAEIAARLSLRTNSVLRYANSMTEIDVVPIKLRGRFVMRLLLAEAPPRG